MRGIGGSALARGATSARLLAMNRIASVDALVVDAEARRELSCGVCLSLLAQPVQCQRGHLFCRLCMEQHLGSGADACPTCRVPVTLGSLSRALYVEKAIRTLRLHCRFRFGPAQGLEPLREDPHGCSAVVLYEQSAEHESVCPFRFVACPYRGCAAVGLRECSLPAHLERCEWRVEPCPHCTQGVRFCERASHLKTCTMLPVDCALCGEVGIPVSRLDAHECPEEEVRCPFAEAGCTVRLKRRALAEHLQANTVHHLSALQDRVEDVQRRMARSLTLRDDRIAVLEELLRRARDQRMTHTLVWGSGGAFGRPHKARLTPIVADVHWATTLKEAPFVRSRSFSIGGFSFFFGMWPRGEQQQQKQHQRSSTKQQQQQQPCLSVFLFLESRSLDYSSISVDFSIALVNETYANMTIVHQFENVTFPIAQRGEGWGEDRILATAAVTRESGFVTDTGHLRIQSVFRVVNVQFAL